MHFRSDPTSQKSKTQATQVKSVSFIEGVNDLHLQNIILSIKVTLYSQQGGSDQVFRFGFDFYYVQILNMKYMKNPGKVLVFAKI